MFFIRLTIDLSDVTLHLTSLDGQSCGVTNQGQQQWYLAPTTPANQRYATVSLTSAGNPGVALTAGSTYSYDWYDTQAHADAGGSTGKLDSTAIANITAHSYGAQVKASAGSRVRLTTTNPSSADESDTANDASGLYQAADISYSKKFYTAFTDGEGNSLADVDNVVVGNLTIADHGVVSGGINFFYSLVGNASSDCMRNADGSNTFENAAAKTALEASEDLRVTFTIALKNS